MRTRSVLLVKRKIGLYPRSAKSILFLLADSSDFLLDVGFPPLGGIFFCPNRDLNPIYGEN